MTSKRKPQKRTSKSVFEQIPDTADNIAKAVLSAKPRKSSGWEYLKR